MNLRKWYKIKRFIPGFVYTPLLDTYYFLRSFPYKGNRVYCACCEKEYDRFYPDNSPFGECPGCGSSARHRLISLYLQRETGFFNKKLKVLHIAPEHSTYKRFKRLKNIDYITADLGSARAQIKMDITDIPFENDTFDVILSSHVLEHIEDDIKAMKELYRVQKPEGWSIHQVPIDKSREQTYEDKNIVTPDQREKIYGHHDHKRIYGLDYTNRLERAGFKVKCDSFSSTLSDSELLKYGIDPGEIIYLCSKE
jgi:SAM-dependent methyltransferase